MAVKYVFVTGGVVSGLGNDVSMASINSSTISTVDDLVLLNCEPVDFFALSTISTNSLMMIAEFIEND